MRAAWYTQKGEARKVLKVGDFILPQLLDNELQVSIRYSGLNTGEISKRVFVEGSKMPYPLVIPQSDGVGIVTKIGKDIDENWLNKEVVVFGAQSYRPFGTAAELTNIPLDKIVELLPSVDIKQAAQLGIPAITGYQSVTIFESLKGKNILVQGGAGAVNQWAIKFASTKGANVITTVLHDDDIVAAQKAGADEVFVLDKLGIKELVKKYQQKIDGVVEVSFNNNLKLDLELLRVGGEISVYSSASSRSYLPFWELIYNNISIHFLGSDDFKPELKKQAMTEAVEILNNGWEGLKIGKIFPLDDIALAHEALEQKKYKGRILIKI